MNWKNIKKACLINLTKTNMENKIRFVWILLLFSLCNVHLPGYGSLPAISEVRHIGYADGLSSLRVYSVVEDKYHAIWISTKSGVDRYNGHTIKNYKMQDDYYYGDLAARIIQLSYMQDGILKAYDNTGKIYRYSETYDAFKLEMQLSNFVSGNITLNKYLESGDGSAFCGLTSGLYLIGCDRKVLRFIPGLNVNDMFLLGSSLYVATTSGLKVVDTRSGRIGASLMDGFNIQTLYYDAERRNVFIGTFNSGLWIYRMDGACLERVGADTDFFNNPIRSIIKYDPATLMIGIDGSGIFTYDYGDRSIRQFIDSGDNDNDAFLMSNGIYTIFKDTSKSLWVGSYTGGVSRIIFSKYPVSFITHKKNNAQSLVSNNVKSIAESGNGDLWFATERGISICTRDGHMWKHLLPNKVCVALCRDSKGGMIVGTYGHGIYIMDAMGRMVKNLTKQADGITSNYIFSIAKDGDGDYWVGSIDGSLMNFDKQWRLRKTYNIKQVLTLENIGRDVMAAGTTDGFYLINKRSGKVLQFATAKEQMAENMSAYIIAMQFNRDRTVWLGTEGGGLVLYDYAARKIRKHFTVSEGLPSNDVYGLQTDLDGRLWISTGNGIAVMNNDRIWNLNYVDKINQEYNKAACIMTASGNILFGSTNGVVELKPSGITMLDYDAPLRLTRFDVDVPGNAGAGMIKSLLDMLAGKKVTLEHDQNSFSINFESINLRYQNDIIYKFILEGYDNRWSEACPEEFAQYKNVNPGKYTFRVCSISKSTGRIIDRKSVVITILPPWWQTWWAWLCYIIILGLVCYFGIRYKLYQMQKKHSDDKINFFINTSHDIRTPITLVMAPLEDMRKETNLPDNVRYLLGLAHANIRKLYSLTSQLLEFEKIGNNMHKVKLVSIDLCAMLTEEVACFHTVCDKKGLTLSLALPSRPVCVKATQRMLEIIFDNLISNACKYTNNGGTVRISLVADAKKVVVDVEDTGIGIPQNGQKHIFSDVYRARNAHESQDHGLGFGLLQVRRIISLLHGKIKFSSKEGVGTTFTVTLDRTFVEAVPSSRQSSIDDVLDEVMDPEVMADMELGNSGETILVVEDNDDLRRYLCRTLSPYYKVIGKPTADEALAYLETDYPDLIVSDVMMPGTQGDDFCRMVKERPETSGIPVILLTAKTNHEAEVAGLEKGADDYLTKPFSSEILKLKIKGMIDNRKRMREFLFHHAVNKVDVGKGVQPMPQPAEDSNEVPLSDSDRMFVEKATDIVLSNISNTEFSIDILCREMAMSRTLFYSRLKSLTGKAPQEFIRLIRLQRAAELLRKGTSVIDVSEATGFINVKYFSTVFKKNFGIQPSRFAEEEHGINSGE